MNRRAFIALLTAPMIVRASSLDALPRGVPLDPIYRATISLAGGGGFCHVTAKRSRVLEVIAHYEKTLGVGWYSYSPASSGRFNGKGETLKTRTIPQTEIYQTVRA